MLRTLKEQVWQANLQLPKYNLVTFTWGNVSGVDRQRGLIVIKPSGIKYDELKVEDMVVVDFNGSVVEGRLSPSSDTPTHIELYRRFASIEGIVHTHSPWATIFAQAGQAIEAYGTTHADYFYGDIPVTRAMTDSEIRGDYELNTGCVIAETFKCLNENEIPAVLVNQHGPFCWGISAAKAVETAVVLEEVARMNYYTFAINKKILPIGQGLMDKHYMRKHGQNAYYGQKS